ncbi:MAG: hypothetical protein ACE5Q3_01035 [Alphaproteobacteria bacterium]
MGADLLKAILRPLVTGLLLVGCATPGPESEFDRLTRLATEYIEEQVATDHATCVRRHGATGADYRRCVDESMVARAVQLDNLINEIDRLMRAVEGVSCRDTTSGRPVYCVSI